MPTEPRPAEDEADAAARSRSRRSRASSSGSRPRSRRARRAVAELERKLADDWTNVETLAAHRRARDELQALLSRWEELFEKR